MEIYIKIITTGGFIAHGNLFRTTLWILYEIPRRYPRYNINRGERRRAQVISPATARSYRSSRAKD